MAKQHRISFRADEVTKARLEMVAKQVRLSESALAEACVDALIAYVEEHGEITLPLVVLPKSAISSEKKPGVSRRDQGAEEGGTSRRTG